MGELAYNKEEIYKLYFSFLAETREHIILGFLLYRIMSKKGIFFILKKNICSYIIWT